ncbi:MAG: TonB-dependent receptor [Mediterranea sp.]|nr:TonB-dependent receptor [Mediterranea sp.]
MFKLSVLLVSCLFATSGALFAQTYKIEGKVTDLETKETLTGVSFYVKEHASQSAITDNRGNYTLNLPKGQITLIVSYSGYVTQQIQLSVTKNINYDISLSQIMIALNEVVISSKSPDASVADPQTGVTQMEVKQMNKLPILFGERDIIKSLNLMPGIKSAGEGSTGLFVRGGTSDQNLIMLDNVPLYNASHLMGFFSTFNSDVLRDVSVYKGAIPAQYGERVSAILDVQQRNGNIHDYHLSGGIGLISSKVNAEGPIQKGKSSFLLGVRRTYADAVARSFGIEEASNAYLYFYDLNMKLHFIVSSKDQLSVSGYLGKDKMIVKDMANTGWGNSFLIIKHTRRWNEKLSSVASLFYNQYAYDYRMEIGMTMSGKAIIKDYGFKKEFHYQVNDNNVWLWGLHSTYHNISPGDYYMNSENEETFLNLHRRYSWENGLYMSNQLKVNDQLEVIYGARLSVFSAMGNGEYYKLDENKEITDTIWYPHGKFVKTYVNLEPRLSAVYKFNDYSSVKTSYARTTQNIHLLTQSVQASPYDRWTSSSNNIKPQIADQYSIGYFRNFFDNTYELSMETYYKNMRNQLDYKDYADFGGSDVVETDVLCGKGRAYGLEFMLKKRTGTFTGWVSYTLAKSEKKIDGINNNQWYNAYQDRTHDVSIVGIYELSPKWTFSAAWVYYTGNAITFPSGKYQIDRKDVMYYAERNGYRTPAYHRLDVGATYLVKKTAKYESELAFSLYNAYGRRNAYMIRFETNKSDLNQTSAYRYSLFTYIPSVSWNFKF